jgi:protein-tyrosine phosphatase
MYRVLFVCLGNICRSPLADGVLAHKLSRAGLGHLIEVDSAGTGAYHIGEPPHVESMRVARQHGMPIDHLRARQVKRPDFESFDLIVAMDRKNHSDLLALESSGEHHHKVKLFMAYVPEATVMDVPDPYFGGPAGFDEVFALVETGCDTILAELGALVVADRRH